MAIDESGVVALAGLFQASDLVRQCATRGRCDDDARRVSLASVFTIDAASAAAVFGDVGGVRYGLKRMVAQLEQPQRDAALIPLVVSVLRLARRLRREPKLQRELRAGIEAIAAERRADTEDSGIEQPFAALYQRTLSRVRPQIRVSGEARWLEQPAQVERIRALLLAAVRAAVLWHQCGGRQWDLLLHRHRAIALARGLLSRTTLERG